jgi:hypothetical protein
VSRRARLPALAGDPRLVWSTAASLLVVVAGSLAFQVAPSLVLILLLSVLAIALVIRLIGSAELGWPAHRNETSSHGWVGVAMLSHSLAVADSAPWEFDRVIRPRLARLATAALIREGVDWDTPQAREILGTPVHDALRHDVLDQDAVADAPTPSASGAAAASRTALAAATLDSLDRLEKAATDDVRTRP